MGFYLSLEDVPDLARGAAILGTGPALAAGRPAAQDLGRRPHARPLPLGGLSPRRPGGPAKMCG